MFWGEQRRLYKDVQLAYIVSDHENPANHLIYAVQEDIGSSILHINDEVSSCVEVENKLLEHQHGNMDNAIWKMYFDGSSLK